MMNANAVVFYLSLKTCNCIDLLNPYQLCQLVNVRPPSHVSRFSSHGIHHSPFTIHHSPFTIDHSRLINPLTNLSILTYSSKKPSCPYRERIEMKEAPGICEASNCCSSSGKRRSDSIPITSVFARICCSAFCRLSCPLPTSCVSILW